MPAIDTTWVRATHPLSKHNDKSIASSLAFGAWRPVLGRRYTEYDLHSLGGKMLGEKRRNSSVAWGNVLLAILPRDELLHRQPSRKFSDSALLPPDLLIAHVDYYQACA